MIEAPPAEHATRVFIPFRSPRFDLSSAESFGEIHPLMDGADRVSPFDPSAIARVFERELANADFDDHSDLLAIAGPTIYTSIMVAQVLARYGRAKLLLYDARATRYVSRDVELPRPISGGTE